MEHLVPDLSPERRDIRKAMWSIYHHSFSLQTLRHSLVNLPTEDIARNALNKGRQIGSRGNRHRSSVCAVHRSSQSSRHAHEKPRPDSVGSQHRNGHRGKRSVGSHASNSVQLTESVSPDLQMRRGFINFRRKRTRPTMNHGKGGFLPFSCRSRSSAGFLESSSSRFRRSHHTASGWFFTE